MNKEVYFFYDESGHSRSITANTIHSNEFRYDFISTIVGIEKNNFEEFEKEYLSFEENWGKKFSCEELKSSIIKTSKYNYGLASFKKQDIMLYTDFFKIILHNNLYLHFGVFNKIEYLINQMLMKSSLLNKINYEGVSYAMTKALCVYRPKSVLDSIENDINNFLPRFKNFLEKRRNLNVRIHGESEEYAFSQLLDTINSINIDITLKWNYVFSFDGFQKFIKELKLTNHMLLIDKEGVGKTKQAAVDMGISTVFEEDSKKSSGIRCADLLGGFLSNMLNSIELATSYDENENARNESLLNRKWFENISSDSFNLYKLAYEIFCKLNQSWYKFYCSNYRDGITLFVALLSHFNEYESFEDFEKDTIEYHQRKTNSNACQLLQEYHKVIDKNYNVEFVNGIEYYFNQKGAKCYYDYHKHDYLELPSDGNSIDYLFLSVGFFNDCNNSLNHPCATISNNGKPICYLLPKSFKNWVRARCQESLFMKKNIFPCYLKITNKNNKFNIEYVR